jgi:hypothetical protein
VAVVVVVVVVVVVRKTTEPPGHMRFDIPGQDPRVAYDAKHLLA